MNTFVCIYCGKTFEGRQSVRSYCSKSCQISHRNTLSKGKIKRTKKSIEKQKNSLKYFWSSEKGKEEKKKRSERAIKQSHDPKYKQIFANAMRRFNEDIEKVNAKKQKQSNTIKLKLIEGTHNIWKTRNIKSYPEIYVENYFLHNNINFEREKYISKKVLGLDENGGFFLDFYFDCLKLDLEIDGAQHQKEERKLMDDKRDFYLQKNGYAVIRIPWVNLKSTKQREQFLKCLDNIIKKINAFQHPDE